MCPKTPPLNNFVNMNRFFKKIVHTHNPEEIWHKCF